MNDLNPPDVTPSDGSDGSDGSVADTVVDAVDENPWIEKVFQFGWIAKAIVYIVMGVAAIQIARQDSAADSEASPEGSVAAIADAPLGRLLLGVLAVGLVLYVVWRIVSVVIIRGNGAKEWGDRVGYSFSAIFYVLLAYTAGKAAVTGIDPEEPNTVESLSKSVMEMSGGRLMVGAAGVVLIVIGLYFAIHKGIQRSFTEELDGVQPRLAHNDARRTALVIAGVFGWIGRGVVTVLVGYFVLRSAIRFDSNDARGFDQSLRQVAGTTLGTSVVFACAVGLLAYGVFCFASYRFQSLKD